MSAEHLAESADLAELLGGHIFLHGFTTFDGPKKPRCTCGHVYENPNASDGFSHPRHVAEVLVGDGWRHQSWLSDALKGCGYCGNGSGHTTDEHVARGLPAPPASEDCSGCGDTGPLSREFCDECHLRMSTPSATDGGA